MITVKFVCGHEVQATGNEEHIRCTCGETAIAQVKTRAPKFRGYALGPCAQFEQLPAQEVSLKSR